jgi:hypothetical protein
MEQSAGLTPTRVSRAQILSRLLFTVLYLVLFGVVHFLITLAVVFQYIIVLANLRPSEPLRRVANQLAAYGYRVMRYLTLNDNLRPFPLSEFPQEMDPPVGEVRFE